MKFLNSLNYKNRISNLVVIVLVILIAGCSTDDNGVTRIKKNEHIILIGNNLGSRMQAYGFFDTELHVRYPDSLLYIRNMCDGGDTPGFRPHSSRPAPWAFQVLKNFRMNWLILPRAKGIWSLLTA
jgi:hypothetical protein